MAALLLIVLVERSIIGGVVLLLPWLPIPTVLILERWVLSNFSFSSKRALVVFRVGYLCVVFFSVYLTFVLALTLW
jgi:hypothetical protein